jgi:two-component system CitB family sensor kinase
VRDIARRDGGDVWVADPGGPPPDVDSGAVFCARLAGVVEPPDADPPAGDASDTDPYDPDPDGARA